ncbi:unnamed protein product [Symbiodinium sp. CCMP2592]|nr:unnamed protein product [Symbiodinium sp. CCMP2592]
MSQLSFVLIATWMSLMRTAYQGCLGVRVAVQLDNARKAAANEEDETLKVRRELQKRFLELETRVREFVQDWRAFEHDGQRLTLLQERVTAGLHEESEGRRAVRSEVQKLIGILQDLDQQRPTQLFLSPQMIWRLSHGNAVILCRQSRMVEVGWLVGRRDVGRAKCGFGFPSHANP